MALIDGLNSYWKFDVDSGDQIDSHGSNDLTNNGATFTANGFFNNAFSYITNDYMTPDNQPIATYPSNMSLSVWIYRTSAAALMLIASGNTDTNNGSFNLFAQNNGTVLFDVWFTTGSINNRYRATSTNTITLNQWVHITATYDASDTGNEMKIRIDGNEESIAKGSPGNFNQFHNTIGGGATAWAFTGRIDEFGLWGTTKTSAETAELYNSGSGLAYPFSAGTNAQINIGDTWKTIEGVKINIGDAWKDVTGMQINIGDTWKQI